MTTRTVLQIFGLPVRMHDISWADTKFAPARQKALVTKVQAAPKAGLLVIQGDAAPVVNTLLEEGRKVRGVDFVARASQAFDAPQNPLADVIVIYGVGSEVSTNYKVSGMVLRALLEFYKNRSTLIVIETVFTKTELLHSYDVRATTFLKIQLKDEESWL